MAKHSVTPSPPPLTYMARPPLHGLTIQCPRCKRIYSYPEPGGPAIRCECGWRYLNRNGLIEEEFRPRLGV